MHALIAASGITGWSYGGSILTFAFPMLLFIFVAATLYVAFTKPHTVPGQGYELRRSSAVTTAEVGEPAAADAPQTPPVQAGGQ